MDVVQDIHLLVFTSCKVRRKWISECSRWAGVKTPRTSSMVFSCRALPVSHMRVYLAELDMNIVRTSWMIFSFWALSVSRVYVYPIQAAHNILRTSWTVFSCWALSVSHVYVYPIQARHERHEDIFDGILLLSFINFLCVCVSSRAWHERPEDVLDVILLLSFTNVLLVCASSWGTRKHPEDVSGCFLPPCFANVRLMCIQQSLTRKSRGYLAWCSHALFYHLWWLRFWRICCPFCTSLHRVDLEVWFVRTSYRGFSSFGWLKSCQFWLQQNMNWLSPQ